MLIGLNFLKLGTFIHVVAYFNYTYRREKKTVVLWQVLFNILYRVSSMKWPFCNHNLSFSYRSMSIIFIFHNFYVSLRFFFFKKNYRNFLFSFNNQTLNKFVFFISFTYCIVQQQIGFHKDTCKNQSKRVVSLLLMNIHVSEGYIVFNVYLNVQK